MDLKSSIFVFVRLTLLNCNYVPTNVRTLLIFIMNHVIPTNASPSCIPFPHFLNKSEMKHTFCSTDWSELQACQHTRYQSTQSCLCFQH